MSFLAWAAQPVDDRTGPDDGASSVEYGLLASLIAAVVVLAVMALGVTAGGLFDRPCSAYRDVAAAPVACQISPEPATP